MTWW